MKRSTRLGLALAIMLISSMPAFAQEAPASEVPEKQETKKSDKPKTVRLIQPWNKLSTLTDEQKAQIQEIHQAALKEEKAIKEKEKSDIMAILTGEQKTELETMLENDAARKKARAAEKKAKDQEMKPTENAGEMTADDQANQQEAQPQNR